MSLGGVSLSGEVSSGHVSPVVDCIAHRVNVSQRWSRFLLRLLGFWRMYLKQRYKLSKLLLFQEHICDTRVDCRDGGDITHCFFNRATSSPPTSVATISRVSILLEDTVRWWLNEISNDSSFLSDLFSTWMSWRPVEVPTQGRMHP